MKAREKRGPRGPLLMISMMMFGSAMLRFGEGAGQAYALQTEPAGELICPIDETPEVIAALQAREAHLIARENAVEDKIQALSLAEAATREQLAKLEAAEKSLASTIALSERAAEDDLQRLTKVYETMKPKDAAALFEEMSPDFAAGFLSRMQPESAASVMAGLTPRTAYAFSVLLAGRNALAPTE